MLLERLVTPSILTLDNSSLDESLMGYAKRMHIPNIVAEMIECYRLARVAGPLPQKVSLGLFNHTIRALNIIKGRISKSTGYDLPGGYYLDSRNSRLQVYYRNGKQNDRFDLLTTIPVDIDYGPQSSSRIEYRIDNHFPLRETCRLIMQEGRNRRELQLGRFVISDKFRAMSYLSDWKELI